MKKFSCTLLVTMLIVVSFSTLSLGQTTVSLAAQCDCEVKKPGTEVTAGATTPAGTNAGDLLVDASGDIFYWDGDSWELSSAGGSASPWIDVASGNPATQGNTFIELDNGTGGSFQVHGGGIEIQRENPSFVSATKGYVDFKALKTTDLDFRIQYFNDGIDSVLSIGNYDTGINAFNIAKNNGYLGLGTRQPNQKLEVTGGIVSTLPPNETGTHGAILGFYNTTGSHSSATLSSVNNITSIIANRANGGNGGMSFDEWRNGTYEDTWMYFHDNGNVGISTESPVEKLEVNGNGYVRGNNFYVLGRTQLGEDGLRMIGNANGWGYIDHKGAGGLIFRTDNNDGGSARMVIDGTTGRVGIGTVGIVNPERSLHINAVSQLDGIMIKGSAEPALTLFSQGGSDPTHWDIFSGGGGNASFDGHLTFYNRTDGQAPLAISPSGNVGVSSLSPKARLSIGNQVGDGVFDSWDDYQLLLFDTGAPASSFGIGISANTMDLNAVRYRFRDGNTAKEVWIEDGGLGYASVASANGLAGNIFSFGWNGSSAFALIDGGAAVINIGSASDYRIKNNVKPLTNSLDLINRIQPKTYFVNGDDTTVHHGVIAHELQAVLPFAVTGIKDAKMADGSDKIQTVNYEAIVPDLVGAVQELSAKVEALEKENATLKAQAATVENLQSQLDALRAMIEQSSNTTSNTAEIHNTDK